MDKKSEILLVCLGAISLLAVGIAVWIYMSSQEEIAGYIRTDAELKKENTSLQEKLDSSLKQARQWQDKSEAINIALNKLDKEHTLLQSQYESLLKEKESISAQNKTLSEEVAKLNQLYSEEKEKSKLGGSDELLASLLKEKAQSEVELEKLQEKVSSYEAQLQELTKELEPSQEKIAQLEKEKQVLEENLADTQKVTEVLSNDLLKERKKKNFLEEDLTQAKEKLAQAQMQLKAIIQEEGEEDSVSAESPSIELPPIVVKAEEEEVFAPRELSRKPTAGLSGRIITVNEKHKFIVIDLGRDNGVQNGMSFAVYRNGEKVGRVEVIETRKNISACDIKEISIRGFTTSDTVQR